MCGICGILNREEPAEVLRPLLSNMVDQLSARGPDEQSVHTDGKLGFGHARLSIIDLEGGQQPLFNEDKSIVVICNGEIYNYREIRHRLKEKGHRFHTQSDCEVLVHLWEESGTDMLNDLRGMFAFVLYDKKKDVLFGARDFFGQKPLYYHQGPDLFAFSSEVKSLLLHPQINRNLDLAALDQFLFYRYVPHPRTMFTSIKQLPAGHYFLLENNRLTIDRYWKSPLEPESFFQPDRKLTPRQWTEIVKEALFDAVESHLVSDVPVGVFLSGGIDSCLITAIAAQYYGKPLQTFSIAFTGSKQDESTFAWQASQHFKTQHTQFEFLPAKVEEYLTQTSAYCSQPLADSAILPLYALSQQAAKHVKVVLTGDGGDELFGGYRKYRRGASALAHIMWKSSQTSGLFSTKKLAQCAPDRLGYRRMQARLGMALVPPLRCTYKRKGWEGWDRYALYSDNVRESMQEHYTDESDWISLHDCANTDPVNAMLSIDQNWYLPDDLLLKTDHATMAHSLESRAPLLDHRLASIAGGLPTFMKATSQQTKVVLRNIASQLLPVELASRPKKGFTFPISQWLRDDLKTWVHESLCETSVMIPQLFQPKYVRQILDEHNTGKYDHGVKIYTLLTLELWHRNFIG
ncbi:MAG: asparagine synthase (glutamine-hydrolyzing) [Pseudomonadales bacterium]